jgi:hypothetical protein
MLVAGGVDVHDAAPGRVRLAAIADCSARSLHPFVKASEATDATARTDSWSFYPGVRHAPHVVGSMAPHLVPPWTHRVFANLKAWTLNFYHGLREKHVQSYFDDVTFRFNDRRTRHAAFRSLIDITVA